MLIWITTKQGNHRCDFIPSHKVSDFISIVLIMGCTIDLLIGVSK